jgi:hypothetical protein
MSSFIAETFNPTPVLLDEGHSDSCILACPHCRGDYLHHTGVSIYERECEDGATTEFRISAGRGDVGLDPDQNRRATAIQIRQDTARDNPSDRRGGIAIRFYCEFCNKSSELIVSQHKGNSYFAWRTPCR